MPKVKKTIEKETKKTSRKKTRKKIETKVKKVTKEIAAKEITAKEITAKEITAKKIAPRIKYWEAVGRRKTAVARVRIFTRGTKEFSINDKKLEDYFFAPFLRQIVMSPLETLKLLSKFKVLVKTGGGGVYAQAEAVRHGLSRTLVKFNPNFRKRLKKAGFLTRDPRMKERKKFGLKKARKAPQWSKR